MLDISPKHLKDNAVYWAKLGHDDWGQPTYANPVEIKCWWNTKQVEYLDKDGRLQLSKGVVYVDQDLVVEGLLWNGQLTDLAVSMPPPTSNQGAWEIKQYNNTPDRTKRRFLRMAYI